MVIDSPEGGEVARGGPEPKEFGDQDKVPFTGTIGAGHDGPDGPHEGLEPRRPGRPRRDLGPPEKEQFLRLVEAGYGRCLALGECGFGHRRALVRAFEADPEFKAEVEFAERVVEDLAMFNITRAALEGRDVKASMRYLNVRWRVRAMNEARRAARHAREIAERQMRLKEGLSGPDGDDALDVSRLTSEELATLGDLLAKCQRSAPGAPRGPA